MADDDNIEHIRLNPLTNLWVLVCPHRENRPWKGQVESAVIASAPEWDPTNPLCPRVKRPSGEENPNYKGIFVFENDFPALRMSTNDIKITEEPQEDLFQSKNIEGICRVMCYHPNSSVSIGKMQKTEVVDVIKEWISQFTNIMSLKNIKWVQIFENRGKEMGCSNPHPHCQIWSSSFLPNEIISEDHNQKKYTDKNKLNMLLEYAKQEEIKNKRVILKNQNWIIIVPYWATWPFETIVLPRIRHIPRLSDLTDEEIEDLSVIMIQLYKLYDSVFSCPFPFSMGWHCAPSPAFTDSHSEDLLHWQLHAHFYPPLLRSATVKKFMVGYEMLATPQRDLTPEMATKRLLTALKNLNLN